MLANPHGLHARPAKVLAQLAKGFEGEIRVRVVDSAQPAVSVKSLSKLLSLGARRGQTLELVAEPGIAADALPVLLAAIEQGLGEEVEPLAQREATIASVAADVLQAPWPVAVSRAWALPPALPAARRMCVSSVISIIRYVANPVLWSGKSCVRP